MQSEYSKDTGPGSDATPTFAPPTQASSSPSTSSVEDSPARMSVRQANGQEWNRELARVFGLNSPASLGSFERSENPSAGFSLKTSQACLFPIAEKTEQSSPLEYPELLESWPDSGMWDVTEAYELKNSAPVISENECLSLACTPDWRTPDTPSSGGPRNRKDSIGQGHQVTIAEQAENWNTPHGMSNRDFRGKTGGCGGGEFAKQANQWPTPLERDFRSGETIAEYGNSRPLNESVVNWTPHNTREHDSDNSDSTYLGRLLQGPDCPPLLQDPPIPDGPKSCETSRTSRRRLNPRFVEWLMGFPIGWTEPCSTAPGDSEDSETL